MERQNALKQILAELSQGVASNAQFHQGGATQFVHPILQDAGRKAIHRMTKLS